MSRAPTFDPVFVLEAALALFWKNGFRGTSLIQLERATGLRPGSIYNSFGSKKELFLSVVEHYTKNVVEPRVADMTSHPNPRLGIQEFFTSSFELVPANQLNGCLLTNTATDVCIEDSDIKKAVKAGISKIEAGFHRNLVRMQQASELPEPIDIKAMAIHLTSCFQGMEVMAKLNHNKKQLRLLSVGAMSAL